MRVLILMVGVLLFLSSSLAFSGEGRRILAEQELHSGAGAKEGAEELSLFSHRGEAGAGYSFYGGNQDFSLFHYSARYRGLKPESFEIEAASQGLFGYEKGYEIKQAFWSFNPGLSDSSRKAFFFLFRQCPYR
jgi:hypothetical protein